MLSSTSLARKLLLMLVAPLVGIIFFGALGMAEKMRIVREAGDIEEMGQVVVAMSELVSELQRERGLSVMVAEQAQVQSSSELTRQHEATDKKLDVLKRELSMLSDRLGERFASGMGEAVKDVDALRMRRERVRAGAGSSVAQEIMREYTAVNDKLMGTMISVVGLTSNLEIHNLLLGLVLLAEEKEIMGIERATLARVFSTGRMSADHLALLRDVWGARRAYHETFEVVVPTEIRQYYDERLEGKANIEVERMRKIAIEKGGGGGFGVDPSAWFSAATRKIDAYREVEAQITTLALERVTTFKKSATRALLLFSGLALAAIFTALLVAYLVARSITLPLNGASASVHEVSNQIVAAIQQQSASASETATAVSQTTTTVEEIRRTSELSVQKANAVVDVADRGTSAGKEGTQAVALGIEAMRRIRTEVESIAKNILDLSEKNLQIGDIVQTVNGLAEQSNLLAVNASIEAAKAGEHGRGFAVVASEVKALAEQSKDATKQIRAMLGEIQKSSNAAVMVTEQGTKRVEEGLRIIEELGRTIDSIARINEENADAARQISSAAGQQLVGIEQITAAMRNIEQATRDNAAGIHQLERSAQDLRKVSERVAQVIRGGTT